MRIVGDVFPGKLKRHHMRMQRTVKPKRGKHRAKRAVFPAGFGAKHAAELHRIVKTLPNARRIQAA